MNDPSRMNVIDGPRQLDHESGGLARSRPALADIVHQGHAPDAFRDDERMSFMKIDIHDFQKIGMTTRDHKPAFATELFASRRVIRCAASVQFENEFSSQLRIQDPEELSVIVGARERHHEIRADSRWQGAVMPICAWFPDGSGRVRVGARLVFRCQEARNSSRDIALLARREQFA